MNSTRYPVSDKHRIQTKQLEVSPRLLLGPGPSNAHPRVLQALSMRQVGHLDPEFIAIMNEVQSLLRYAWQTDNQMTIPVSGTGSAASSRSSSRGGTGGSAPESGGGGALDVLDAALRNDRQQALFLLFRPQIDQRLHAVEVGGPDRGRARVDVGDLQESAAASATGRRSSS